jgi:hypothetical protein
MTHEISMMCRHLGLRRAMEGVIATLRREIRPLAVGRADGEGLPDPLDCLSPEQLSYWFLLLWSLVNEWLAKDRERHLSEP